MTGTGKMGTEEDRDADERAQSSLKRMGKDHDSF